MKFAERFAGMQYEEPKRYSWAPVPPGARYPYVEALRALEPARVVSEIDTAMSEAAAAVNAAVDQMEADPENWAMYAYSAIRDAGPISAAWAKVCEFAGWPACGYAIRTLCDWSDSVQRRERVAWDVEAQ